MNGKGTPTTTIDMRRITDGVKTVITVKTTDTLEKAFVEEVPHNYLYKDGDEYIFINNENYDQVSLTEAMIGDGIGFLQENAECKILMFDGKAITITLPTRVTMAILSTEPVVKGQTASSSYKPALLDNGVRIMVPPFINADEEIIVHTELMEYSERA